MFNAIDEAFYILDEFTNGKPPRVISFSLNSELITPGGILRSRYKEKRQRAGKAQK